MAILKALPGIEVQVYVKDEPATEYENKHEETEDDQNVTEHQAERTVTRYIESVTNEEFRIEISVSESFMVDSPALAFNVFIDGKRAENYLFSKAELERASNSNKIIISGRRYLQDAEAYLQKFKFAEIKTTNNDAKLDSLTKDAKALRRVGEIDVKIQRISYLSRTQSKSLPVRPTGKEIHEKALKGDAKSHKIQFGAPELIKKFTTRATFKIDGENSFIGIFKFKYRSLESLKHLLVIQEEPEEQQITEAPRQPEFDLNNLNEDQRAQLNQFLQGLMNGTSNGATVDQSDQKKIKREHDKDADAETHHKRKKARTEKIEVDLTGED